VRIHYSLEALKLENPVNSAEQAPLLKNVSFAHAAPALPTLAAPQRLRRADPDTLHSLHGTSMGTHWRVRVGNPQFLPLQTLRSAIEDVLASVVRHMSHWQADSTLAQFNRAPADTWHALPADLSTVLHAGLHWAQASGGAFDPTLGALVAAWGFGPHAPLDPADWRPASPHAIAQAQACSGWQRLHYHPERGWRQHGGLQLDLSGIAKGYAVDAVLLRLHALGLRNALVEIGGELRGSGQRPDGQPWRVAIAPVPAAVGPAPDAPPQAIALRDCAIATSGSLYHRHQWQGRSYSHTLDPRTGAPIAHALASVTVLHAECLHADALATLLTVLGPEAGWEFAEQHGIAALLSSPTARRCSSAWEAAFGKTPFAPALEPHV
jgi:thiamine biosynthesis lipoprotein